LAPLMGIRGDWFLDLFTSEAEKLLEQLASQRPRELGVQAYWWVPGLPEAPGEPPPVAAVDGGGGVIGVQGGGAVYVARAYGYVEGGEPERLLELRFYPARDSRVLDALRTWLEHRVATRLALRLPPGSLLLMDGSLWVTVTAAFTAVAKLASGAVQSLAEVYTGVLSGYALAEIALLAHRASERGVTVLYVSKDHGFRALKEKVLLDAVASSSRAVEPLVSSALDWYPVTRGDRLRLLEARRLLPQEARQLLDAALDQSYRDQAFIADTAGRAPGYSWLLRLPPPRRLHRLVAQRGARGILEAAVDRAEQLLAPGDEALEELRGLASRAARALEELPCSRMLYIRPAPGDPLLLAEEPGAPGTYLAPGRALEEPRGRVMDAVAALARHYAGPDYYNVPLVAAHLNASLDSRQLASYTRLLESLAAARGLRLQLSRRLALGRATSRTRRRRRLLP